MVLIPNCTCTIKRMTSFVLDLSTVAASLTPSRQPARAATMQVYVSGTPTGTVTIAGTVNGSADTEVLTFTGSAARKTTYKSFTAISGITTSLSGGSQISVQACSKDGSPENTYYSLKVGHPATFHAAGAGNQNQEKPGQHTTNRMHARIGIEDIWAPQELDLFVNEQTGETFEITNIERQPGGSFAPMFWKCQLELRQGRGT